MASCITIDYPQNTLYYQHLIVKLTDPGHPIIVNMVNSGLFLDQAGRVGAVSMIASSTSISSDVNHNIIIYDESNKDKLLDKCEFYTNFSKFINDSDLILTNRIDNRISKYLNKVYTPDLFKEN